MSSNQEACLDTLWEKVKEIEIAMFVTTDDEGLLRSRPMATQKKKFDGAFWFLTALDSSKVAEIKEDEQVNLSYSEPKTQTYASISGKAKVIRDTSLVKEMWNPLYRAWFPKGPEDPNIAVLKVVPEKAEYWDAPSNGMVYVIGLAKAVLSGKAYDGEGSEHVKVDVQNAEYSRH